jgi:hypothetical protein
VKVRDPSQVRLDVDDGRGDQTILAAGGKAEETMVPASSPPFTGAFSPPTALRRGADGSIEVHCEPCLEPDETILPETGVLQFGDELRIRELDWTRSEMKIRFRDMQAIEPGPAPFRATIATPWSNVVSVHRTSTPDRAVGLRLLLSAGITGLLGTLAVIDAVNHSGHTTSLALGVPMLVVTVPLASIGGWYMFAPPREEDLYNEQTSAAPPH